MEFLHKVIKALIGSPVVKITTGTNNLEELLKQFDAPPKKNTPEYVVQDYQIKQTIAAIEVDLLKLDPSTSYKGYQVCYNSDGKKFFDWVPCITRPEVIFCSYGKN
ncbi:MAG: hypothetical protein ACOYNN_19200 [Terrimicrobiaceae bacterium]